MEHRTKALANKLIGLEGATQTGKVGELLAQSSHCFQALTLALASAAAIAGRPVSKVET